MNARIKRTGLFLCMMALCCAGATSAKTDQPPEEQVEILLRALLAVGQTPIDPERQQCNLGAVYLRSINPQKQQPVTISEPLLAELAAMRNGRNRVEGGCTTPSRCHLIFSHADGEDVSSTQYGFFMKDGKVQTDSLDCISTP